MKTKYHDYCKKSLTADCDGCYIKYYKIILFIIGTIVVMTVIGLLIGG